MWDWTLVSLWFGWTVGRTVSWSPKFLGWVDYQIFLPMVLRFVWMELCYKAASKDTKKNAFALAGIYLSRFKPHSSIRSASASAAAGSCWHYSSNEGLVRTLTFAKYYKKPIQQCNMENWQKLCWTVHGKCNLFVTLCQWDLSQWRNNCCATWHTEYLLSLRPQILALNFSWDLYTEWWRNRTEN